MKASLPPEQDPNLEVLETSEGHFPLAVSVANATEPPAGTPSVVQPPTATTPPAASGGCKVRPKKDPVRINVSPKPATTVATKPPVVAVAETTTDGSDVADADDQPTTPPGADELSDAAEKAENSLAQAT